MNNFKLQPGKRALVILAHPDDETIWLSGLIMLNPQINWNLLCLARAEDTDRAPKFRRITEALKIKSAQENLDDLEQLPFLKHVRLAKELIKKHFLNQSFDYVFTHGVNGEYGHRDHKSIHEAVTDIINKERIKTDYLIYLNYKKPKKTVPLVIPRTKSDLLIKLPERIYQEKRRLMSEVYGFAPDGIDTNYCTRVEAFRIKKYN